MDFPSVFFCLFLSIGSDEHPAKSGHCHDKNKTYKEKTEGAKQQQQLNLIGIERMKIYCFECRKNILWSTLFRVKRTMSSMCEPHVHSCGGSECKAKGITMDEWKILSWEMNQFQIQISSHAGNLTQWDKERERQRKGKRARERDRKSDAKPWISRTVLWRMGFVGVYEDKKVKMREKKTE